MALHAWGASLECLSRVLQPPSETNGKTFVLVNAITFWPADLSATVFVTQVFLACARPLVFTFRLYEHPLHLKKTEGETV